MERRLILACLPCLLCLSNPSIAHDDEDGVLSVSCMHDPSQDSTQQSNGAINRIHSEFHGATYKIISLSRNRLLSIDYMVHGAENQKALIVLIAGGQLDAQIEGDHTLVTRASGNFLVRSAHLFAAQGYKVVTIDRPLDFDSFIPPEQRNLPNGYVFDGYRTAKSHTLDLSDIIKAERGKRPVLIAGTSRGTVSAVAQHRLADFLSLSAPLTRGAHGTPIGHPLVSPDKVEVPVQLIWHRDDQCNATPPEDARDLLGAFAEDAEAVEVSGGFNQPNPRHYNPDCQGSRTFHGFVGIESCTVELITEWLADQLD